MMGAVGRPRTLEAGFIGREAGGGGFEASSAGSSSSSSSVCGRPRAENVWGRASGVPVRTAVDRRKQQGRRGIANSADTAREGPMVKEAGSN